MTDFHHFQKASAVSKNVFHYNLKNYKCLRSEFSFVKLCCIADGLHEKAKSLSDSRWRSWNGRDSVSSVIAVNIAL